MRSSIGPRAFHTLLLFFYGTSADLSEAIELERRDVDSRRRRITFHSGASRYAREMPIGSDPQEILLQYDWAHHQQEAVRDPHFFLTKDGAQIKAGNAGKTFQRARKKAGVARYDRARYQPKMQELRYTIAVHRLTASFKHDADMGKMVLALPAYMGQA